MEADKRQIKISVVVPVYNAETFLGFCIDSILCQTQDGVEIILIDDGSSDDSLKICTNYAANNKNITVVHQQNQGANKARQNGVHHASGEWVAFCDADDTLPADALQNLYDKVENTEIVIGYTDLPPCPVELSLEECRQNIVMGRIIEPCVMGKLFKRTLLSDDIFDIPKEIDYGEDTIMNTRLLFKTEMTPYILYKSVYNYRQNLLSISHTKKHSLEHEMIFYDTLIKSTGRENDAQYMNNILRYKLSGLINIAKSNPKSLCNKKHPYLMQIANEIKKFDYKLSLRESLFYKGKNPLLLRILYYLYAAKVSLFYRLRLNAYFYIKKK